MKLAAVSETERDKTFYNYEEPEVHVLGPELIFVIGLVKFVIAVARLVCPDLLGKCFSCFANIYSRTSILVFSKRDLSHTLLLSSELRLES